MVRELLRVSMWDFEKIEPIRKKFESQKVISVFYFEIDKHIIRTFLTTVQIFQTFKGAPKTHSKLCLK